ncbi:MAG: glutamate racemase [Alloprevotella sp.]|nr:glutamate racemase [Alloprevotella sp.]
MKIGIFDSGYGGLTILKKIREALPQYDYLYLGDNARAPYGPHSYEVIYRYTLEAVEALLRRDCQLVILACNTASAKALRTIQMNDLPRFGADRRVLGVIRPTVEAVPAVTSSKHVGLLGTPGTVNSGSYTMELRNIDPELQLTALSCPMWVPLVEYGEHDTPGADYFVKKRIDEVMQLDPAIDTLILGCTHYPLLIKKIRAFAPEGIRIVEQGEYVAASLADYLRRHPELEGKLARGASCRYLTTESPEKFSKAATLFMRLPDVVAERIDLPERQ